MDDFFGIGFGEILLILVVAVIVLGPARMMEFAKTLGRMVGNLKRMGNELTVQVTKELEEEKKAQPPKPDANAGRLDGSA